MKTLHQPTGSHRQTDRQTYIILRKVHTNYVSLAQKSGEGSRGSIHMCICACVSLFRECYTMKFQVIRSDRTISHYCFTLKIKVTRTSGPSAILRQSTTHTSPGAINFSQQRSDNLKYRTIACILKAHMKFDLCQTVHHQCRRIIKMTISKCGCRGENKSTKFERRKYIRDSVKITDTFSESL